VFGVFAQSPGAVRLTVRSALAGVNVPLLCMVLFTVTLNAERVQAKDGVTPFSGSGFLQGGTLVFTTAPFSGVVAEDAGAVTIALTNVADVAGCSEVDADMDMTPDMPCTLKAHVTVTVDGAPVAVTIASADGANYTVTPAAAWPMGATVVVTLDAQTVNLLAQPITAAASVTFTAP
jgi:hypothetical protein